MSRVRPGPSPRWQRPVLGTGPAVGVLALAGLATLGFVGAGAGASMSDSASGAVRGVTIGTVRPGLSSAGPDAFVKSVGVDQANVSRSGSSGTTGDFAAVATQQQGATGVSVGSVSVGHPFDEVVPLTVTNAGSLTLRSLTVTVSGVPSALLADTTALVCVGGTQPATAHEVQAWLAHALQGNEGCAAATSLAALETTPAQLLAGSTLAPSASRNLTVVFVGGYDQAEVGTLFSPTITVAGSDL